MISEFQYKASLSWVRRITREIETPVPVKYNDCVHRNHFVKWSITGTHWRQSPGTNDEQQTSNRTALCTAQQLLYKIFIIHLQIMAKQMFKHISRFYAPKTYSCMSQQGRLLIVYFEHAFPKSRINHRQGYAQNHSSNKSTYNVVFSTKK